MKPNREELERAHYNGLTPADKGTLLDVKARGAEWVIAQWGGKAFGYKEKPKREEITDECCYGSYFEWSAQDGDYEIELGSMPYPLVSYQNTEPVNIDLALAQIAEMESALPDHAPRHEQPMTLNDWLNGATVEEKAKWLYDMDVCRVSSISIEECNSYRHCTDCMRNLLNSPYTEGETTWEPH